MSRKLPLLLTLTLLLSTLHLGCPPTEGPTAGPNANDAGAEFDALTTHELLARALTKLQLADVPNLHYLCECFPEDLQTESTEACHQDTNAPAADELHECFLDQLTDHPEGDQALHDYLIQTNVLVDQHDACVDAIDTSTCSRDILDSIQSCGLTSVYKLNALNDEAPEAIITYMNDAHNMLLTSPCRDLFSN
ncbi:hypothetical protein DL240_11585 [Lujinxingia litoralis]|uniref:Uncharacterized protein n=1 Tax=Lujinxingia litoralis TaxID=2211119 RepID=A0A328C7U4_9DELT|nr:hypothetical protein [Lujinxingia litoralis]RAL22480.1 hypothetical protein DL240_11585 [Lujinxingia litoralis]